VSDNVEKVLKPIYIYIYIYIYTHTYTYIHVFTYISFAAVQPFGLRQTHKKRQTKTEI
jgi:hypothetical protein